MKWSPTISDWLLMAFPADPVPRLSPRSITPPFRQSDSLATRTSNGFAEVVERADSAGRARTQEGRQLREPITRHRNLRERHIVDARIRPVRNEAQSAAHRVRLRHVVEHHGAVDLHRRAFAMLDQLSLEPLVWLAAFVVAVASGIGTSLTTFLKCATPVGLNTAS